MAMKFTQGADATIVGAATTAGLAGAPPDYSKTFQATADSYHTAMMASANMWKDVAGAVTDIAGAAIKKNYMDKNNLDPWGKPKGVADDFKESMQPGLDGIKNLNKASWGIGRGEFTEGGDWVPYSSEEDSVWAKTFGNTDVEPRRLNPWGDEAKALRKQARLQKNQYFRQGTIMSGEIANVQALLSNPEQLLKQQEQPHMETVNALVHSLTGEKTAKGNYLVANIAKEDIGDNIKKGDWVYEMWNDPSAIREKIEITGEIDPNKRAAIEAQAASKEYRKSAPAQVMGADGTTPVVYKVGELQNLLTIKNPDMSKGIKDLGVEVTKTGKLLGNNWGDEGNKILRSDVEQTLGEMVKTRNGLRQAINEKVGHNSFFDDVTKEGGASAQIFSALQSVAQQNVDGTIIPQGPLAAIDDMVDGTPGISQQDLSSPTNIAIVQKALFSSTDPNYNEKFTRQAFLEWGENRFGDYYTNGVNMRTDNRITTDKDTRLRNQQVNVVKSVLKGDQPRSFSFQGGDLKVTVDPINKTITQQSGDEKGLIDPQRFLDLLTKSPASVDAMRVFGKDWFTTIPGEPEEKEKEGGSWWNPFD